MLDQTLVLLLVVMLDLKRVLKKEKLVIKLLEQMLVIKLLVLRLEIM